MTTLTPYFFFAGECREAMEFYKSCFGGELSLMTYGEGQGDPCPAEQKEKIMHGELKNDTFSIMASDHFSEPNVKGNNVQISANFTRLDDLERRFEVLSSNGGKVVYPLHDAFWGDRFGILTDRFGIHWLFTCPLEKK